MNRLWLFTLIATALLYSGCSKPATQETAEEKSAEPTVEEQVAQATVEAPAPAQQEPAKTKKFIKVATLGSAEAYSEFQRNVQTLNNQRSLAIQIKQRIDEETDPARKEAMQKDLDAHLKKLTENNEIMFKNYGFSLLRNYTAVIEQSSVYMTLSQDEIQNIQNQSN